MALSAVTCKVLTPQIWRIKLICTITYNRIHKASQTILSSELFSTPKHLQIYARNLVYTMDITPPIGAFVCQPLSKPIHSQKTTITQSVVDKVTKPVHTQENTVAQLKLVTEQVNETNINTKTYLSADQITKFKNDDKDKAINDTSTTRYAMTEIDTGDTCTSEKVKINNDDTPIEIFTPFTPIIVTGPPDPTKAHQIGATQSTDHPDTTMKSIKRKLTTECDRDSSEYSQSTTKKKSILPKSLLSQVTSFIQDNKQIMDASKLDKTTSRVGKSHIEQKKKKKSKTNTNERLNEDGCEAQDTTDNGEDANIAASELNHDLIDTLMLSNESKKNNQEKSLRRKRKKKDFSTEMATRRPNYFLSLQIHNPKIHEKCREVQETVVEQERALKGALVALSTLHITLMVIQLENKDQIKRATIAMDNCQRLLASTLKNLVTIEIEGISHFRNAVLYADIKPGPGLDMLHKIADAVKETFRQEGIESTDDKGLTPHLTLMKLSKMRTKKVKKIKAELYKDYIDAYFGEETFIYIQLCEMKREDDTGYYIVEHAVPLPYVSSCEL
ncbi:unnamed protein product [Owenia fusiformis]|uniref:A-kinase anchor protein 7-like phosphoesterase domain-containing protein n=1 Tax=Owenia fusiformis TaxID=6347 RepID=A0A8S4N2D3_OWEFU|nr:unnamed protein product [Owenia fusiformis]